jgi:hypothetical protein
MPLYEVGTERLVPLLSTSLQAEKIREWQDLQRLIREQIEILDPDLLVIAEEVGGGGGTRPVAGSTFSPSTRTLIGCVSANTVTPTKFGPVTTSQTGRGSACTES